MGCFLVGFFVVFFFGGGGGGGKVCFVRDSRDFHSVVETILSFALPQLYILSGQNCCAPCVTDAAMH